MSTQGQPVLHVVAGCLFEISIAAEDPHGWRWANPTPEVTLLGEELRLGRHHLRFRAEGEGAAKGMVTLHFRSQPAGDEWDVTVHIVPEAMTDA